MRKLYRPVCTHNSNSQTSLHRPYVNWHDYNCLRRKNIQQIILKRHYSEVLLYFTFLRNSLITLLTEFILSFCIVFCLRNMSEIEDVQKKFPNLNFYARFRGRSVTRTPIIDVAK